MFSCFNNQEVIEQEFHAAISAEKPAASPPSKTISIPSDHDAELGGNDDDNKKRKIDVQTKVVGAINEIEILETSFGVSE